MATPRAPAVSRSTALDRRIDAVRRFNRGWTQRMGLLADRLYDSRWSLAEVRVLYELARAAGPLTARDLCATLGLDAGYLSRMLRGFEARGLVARRRSGADGRERLVALTAAGRRAFAPLDRASQDAVAALLAPLPEPRQRAVVEAMATIEATLGATGARGTADATAAAGNAESAGDAAGRGLLREPRPGDLGWVISRHGSMYAEEFGWDASFELLVAEIATAFFRDFRPGLERCWIAERDDANVGCVFVVRKSARVAQLRLLLVDPAARGLGLGARLVDECIGFARAAGYRKMMLWTNGGLDAARHIYDRRGFVLVGEERHQSFGKDLVGQTLELVL